MEVIAESSRQETSYYESRVIASVNFDSDGGVIPLDRQSNRELQKAAKATTRCYVRDVDAHETVAVSLVNGLWLRPKEPATL